MTKRRSPIFEDACHDGDYGMVGFLFGARAEEKRAAEVRVK